MLSRYKGVSAQGKKSRNNIKACGRSTQQGKLVQAGGQVANRERSVVVERRLNPVTQVRASAFKYPALPLLLRKLLFSENSLPISTMIHHLDLLVVVAFLMVGVVADRGVDRTCPQLLGCQIVAAFASAFPFLSLSLPGFPLPLPLPRCWFLEY